ncbi:MAG: hypothetical protein HZB16_05920 [Armatimonadetes bacterium]|nr:hypothetical protein [Armatimonadota bacterium]
MLTSACRRADRAGSAKPVMPAEVPPLIVAETPKDQVLTAPKRFEEMGVKLDLPSTWAEGVAPSTAGPGAKLLHKADAELPAVLFVGVAARAYEALKKRSMQEGKEPFDEVANRMRDQVMGSPAAGKGTEPSGRLVSEKAWSSVSLARGKVLRYQASDPKPDGQSAQTFVDIYLGEARGGSFYVFTAVAPDEAGLDEAKAVLETVAVTGVKDAGLETPLPPGKVNVPTTGSRRAP